MNAFALGRAFRPSVINRTLKCQPAAALVVLAFLLATGNKVWADAVITDCTEEAFAQALAGGGTVTFSNDCTITLSQPITVYASQTNVIDATGHKVTISGGSAVQIFKVSGNLTLVGLTLSNGKSTSSGGALYVHSNGWVAASNCVFTGNKVVGPNGAAGAAGPNDPVFAFDGGNGGAGGPALGGAIWNGGSLTLTNCTLTNNSVTAGNGGAGGVGGNSSDSLGVAGNGGNGGAGGGAYGGAIYNGGILNLTNCTVSSNSSIGGNGGAGGAAGTGAFGGRTGQGGTGSNGAGGGIYNGQEITVGSCTFAANITKGGNSAAAGSQSSGAGSPGPRGADGVGAGLSSTWSSTIINSTFYTNICFGGGGGNGGPSTGELTRGGVGGNGGNGIGGGVQNSGTMHLENCTLSSCGAHGGTNGMTGTGAFTNDNGVVGQALGGDIANTGGSCTLKNSLIVLPQFGPCGFGTFVDDGYNLISDTSIALPGGRSFANVLNPKLGSFGMNGGPTATISLVAGSPALDRIPTENPPIFPATDQRGVPRPLGPPGKENLADIGAYESALNSVPVIVSGPADITVAEGQAATFRVFAVGKSPLSYQWYLEGQAITNATGSSYTVASAGTTNRGAYEVTITNSYGSTTSAQAFILLTPSIISQPTNVVASLGSNAVFRVTATGDPPLSYQWSYNGTNINGATDSVLTLTQVQTTNIGTYAVQVANSNQVLSSIAVNLDMFPAITATPTNQIVARGDPASFFVTAVGSSPLIYQWQVNGINISGATSNSLNFSSVQQTNVGDYQVIVRNPFGNTTSAPVRLDFAGEQYVYTVRGYVTDGTSPLSDVMIVAGGRTNFTLPDGSYVITGLAANTYTVTPSKDCHFFNPASRTVIVGPDIDQVNFFAYTNDIYTVRGRVTDGVSAVTNVVLAMGDRTITNAADGTYVFTHVCPGSYKIIPSRAGSGFTPASRTVQVASDTSGLDFVSVPVYTLSGLITQGPLGLSNVTVRAGNQMTNTDANGYYVISNLAAGTYTVTPTQACRVFVPVSRTISIAADTIGINFSGIENSILAVRGNAMEGNYPLPGVILTLTGGNQATNGANGYTFINLCAETYTITPSLAGYGFRPASVTFSLTNDVSGLNFDAMPLLSIKQVPDGYQLDSLGNAGNIYYLLKSSDVALPPDQWQALTTNTGPVRYIDKETNSSRFYWLRR